MNQPPLRFGREAERMPSFRSLSANERAILSLLQRHSPLSRAELARRTSLAIPTVSRLCDQLLQEKLVEADTKVMMGSRGQPSLPLSLNADGAFAFGIAVRAEELSVVLLDITGRERGRAVEALSETALDAVTERIAALTTQLASDAEIAPERVAGMGVALPGFFITDPLRINAPLGMDDWAVDALEAKLHAALGLPISIENDGSAAAMGECIYGAGREHDDFAYLYIDRGLGGGLIRNGALQRGAHGNAGEFTGLVPPEQRSLRPTLTLLLEYAIDDGESYLSIAELVEGYTPNASYVERWLADVRPVTELVMSAIASIFDPKAIIFGGRIPSPLAARLIESFNYYSVPVRGRDRPFPEAGGSTFRGDAAAFGAAALVFDRFLV
ncbi:ROK family protein [Sphingobium yanoikuyae]|mgnify:FL=1|jgi:predicted NBD/HSP70 family sugar kinase|uniref:ROK family protein n=3 Tax=Alphaproteobacteria TaxID=28211 RepID=A0A084EPI0_SPHYA|nr:ROK family protein [Novosphingobium resinovorum]KEZ19872.1 ROK family protein [Sphingobium yanoikuyae]PHQ63893.1 MAG: ROK family transcriptional regulator [Sphingobium sp.]RSU51681.1 ROK family transcriptional regulator [Sphingobium yanoikuyae]